MMICKNIVFLNYHLYFHNLKIRERDLFFPVRTAKNRTIFCSKRKVYIKGLTGFITQSSFHCLLVQDAGEKYPSKSIAAKFIIIKCKKKKRNLWTFYLNFLPN